MNIELHIERLILHNFEAVDQLEVQVAINRELTRFINERGVPSLILSGVSASSLNGGEFDVQNDAESASIGAQVAQSIYSGLTTDR